MKVLITTSQHVASFQLAALLKGSEIIFGDHFTDYPTDASNSIAHQILKFCLDHQIEKVFPLAFAEVAELRKSIILFDEFGIEVMLSADSRRFFTEASKIVNSFANLSAGLISLGYPTKKIAIANVEGRGELILIDDAVKDNLQIWNRVKAINFNQLGKWFNQSNFQPVALYQPGDGFQAFYMLVENGELKCFNPVAEDTRKILAHVIQTNNMKGFYHVAIANRTVLRIVNASF
ncbi:hypothetical protein [Pedobacter arcticus]|uniref:hypothetical protein n=1 Tax=Pedobacter arcticus TaxID=752140 RepID=UPI00031D7E8F|nr:hypothetical protein [Pedobacter arcticus]